MSEAASTSRVGSVLDDKWRLTELIGEGGMAAVYGACHLRNGGMVAIKVLSAAAASDATLAGRFLTEGYVANRVTHRGAVRVLDDGRTPDGAPYIVMERLGGCTLDALVVAKGRLPVDDVLRYGLAIAEVLAAAHAVGIVHRDVKPENVFLCDDGTIKLLDFGIAQLKGFTQQARITVAGMTLGTPAFMPAEQVMGHWDRVGPHSDVYAAGGTLFHLLTGEFAHNAVTAQEFMVRAATQQARPVRSIRPEVPPRFAEVVDRALARDPEDRYENGATLLEALRTVSPDGRLETMRSPAVVASAVTGNGPALDAQSPARQTTAPVSSASRNGPRRSRTMPVAIGLFALVGVIAGTASYVASSKSSARPAESPPSSIETVKRDTPSPQPTNLQGPSVNAEAGSSSVVSVTAASVAPTTEVTPSSAAAIGGAAAPKPRPPHDVATAHPTPPTAVPHGPPDPADPLGFH